MTDLDFIAQDTDDGRRVDRAVMTRLVEVSRSRVQQCIADGRLTINDKPVKASHRLRPGDRVHLTIPQEEPLRLEPEDIPLELVYRDEHVILVNKPAGMVVHPGAGIRSGTLANALVHLFGDLPGADELRPGIVHRLDRETSGLLMVTMNEQSRERFAALFRERRITKEYRALVYGAMKESHGLIDKPIGRHPVHRLKMTTRAPRSRPCLTEYFVAEEYPGFSLLRVILHTGRTHQIRVHLASLGRPIVGDTLYGGKRHLQVTDPVRRGAIARMDRFFLHAFRLRFTHPFTGKELEFECPLPLELVEMLDVIRG